MKRNLIFILAAVTLALGCLLYSKLFMTVGIIATITALGLEYIGRFLFKRELRRTTELTALQKLLSDWDRVQLSRAAYWLRYFCLLAVSILLVNDALAMFGSWTIVLGYLTFIEIPVDYVYRKTQRRKIKRRLITRTAILRNQAMQ